MSYMRAVEHGRACMVNYKFDHELPSKSRQHMRGSFPVMRVTADALQII